MATSSHPTHTEEEEEEEVVEVSNSDDKFEVLNQVLSLETSTLDLGDPFTPILDEMGIQRKPTSNLLELIESQLGRDASWKAAQTKPPTPPLPHLPCPSDLNLSI